MRILIIKHGALGDLFFSLGAFEGVRNHFKKAHITLLTSSPYQSFGKLCPFFDDVLIDDRHSPFSHPLKSFSILKTIQSHFDLIIDLQRSGRTKQYMRLLKLMGDRTPWCSIHKGSTYHLDVPSVYVDHILNINARQLQLLGIPSLPTGTLDWMKDDLSHLTLPQRFFILVPGTSPGQDHKKWPATDYGQAAKSIYDKGITPVILGTKNELDTCKDIQRYCPEALSLIGKTSIFQIPALARKAEGALGNDTGPLHACYFSGCPTLYLFSYSSNPNFCGPLEPHGSVLKQQNLKDLSVERVCTHLQFRSSLK